MDRGDLTFVEWMQHLQEELMDAIIYIEKLKDENNKQHN
jgi:tRNA A37 threonylcarbamoyladenosine biosynthesis protein TsaE